MGFEFDFKEREREREREPMREKNDGIVRSFGTFRLACGANQSFIYDGTEINFYV